MLVQQAKEAIAQSTALIEESRRLLDRPEARPLGWRGIDDNDQAPSRG